MSEQLTNDPLLITKLKIPRVQTDLLPRQQLVSQLDTYTQQKLTLITAPAGFGKTTLAYLWAKQLECPVAWLSVDASDNDSKRFWTYLIAALQTIVPSMGISAQKVFLSPIGQQDVGLTILINEISTLDHNLVLVLDDYHLIEGDLVNEGINFLIENMPEQLHLVISSRAEPDLPISRLRARRQLRELRADDLRFSHEEMRIFFNDIQHITLSDAQLNALENRTEGWIAGLQMAALSMQHQSDLDQFITAFTGSHHHILDYLVEEVLEHQTNEVKKFLLQTSILDSLNADLCHAVTGLANTQAILNDLSQRNLFIAALDDERQWFRYHQLFVEFLRNRLRSQLEDEIGGYHQAAAIWFMEQERIPEAIEQWIAGKHYEQAAQMIEEHGAHIFWRYHEWIRLHHWLETLPRHLIHGRPILCAAYGWTYLLTGQPDEMVFYVETAEKALSDLDNGDVLGEVIALKAEYAMIIGDFDTALALSEEASTYLSVNNIIIRSLVSQIQGYIYRNMGNVEQASHYLSTAHHISLRAGKLMVGIFALSDLANVKVLQGRLNEATKIYKKIIHEDTSDNDSSTPISALIGLGNIYREQNQLEKAIDALQQGIELAQQYNISAIVRDGNVKLAYALYAYGDVTEALQACEFAVASGYRSGVDRLIAQVRGHQMNLSIRQNDLAYVDEWVTSRQLSVDEAITYDREWELVVFARLLIARKESVTASTLLERIIIHATQDGRYGNVIEDLVLLALAYDQQGDVDKARETIKQAINYAVAENYIRVFVDGGDVIAKIIRLIAIDSPYTSYLSRLLDAFDTTPVTSVRIDGELLEDLSERELEVLRLLAIGLSNREIAEQLIIGNSTVKTHTLNIYRKLNVNNRTHAVTRARGLHLI